MVISSNLLLTSEGDTAYVECKIRKQYIISIPLSESSTLKPLAMCFEAIYGGIHATDALVSVIIFMSFAR